MLATEDRLQAPVREERIETHLSVVSLFAHDVLKTLKPVRYPFVDLSTPALRRAECEAELVHNRPWAPGVYLDVVDVSGDPPRRVEHGEPAVHMRRMPADRTLVALRDTLDADTLARVGAFIRERHDAMASRPGSSQPTAVWHRIDDNLAELRVALDGDHEPLMARLARARDRLHASTAPLLAERAGSGRALHGDLRAEHVYVLDDGLAILDGVAFSEDLASGDPLEDVAFLAMDLGCTLQRRDLVAALWGGWGAPGPSALHDLYVGHRSLIRAKIARLSGDAEGVLRHLLHALVAWELPDHRPVLIGVGGLPGVGKSTLAREVAASAHLEVLRTDAVRRELGPSDYSEAGRTRVYDEVLARAGALLASGGRVLVDASLGREAWRAGLIGLARRLGVPVLLVFAEAPEAVALRRIAGREGDCSDADERVHRIARAAWEAPSIETARWAVSISTAGPPPEGAGRLRAVLAAAGLDGP
ncbi:MAG: AAA family ATPase [Alphaproteobacteria bacterium]|nr:AAA family ATPase [Alphaproteobacteria bacterium]MCB9692416.1 AAA family ATPase [Alphaproteobacteria bacterium]